MAHFKIVEKEYDAKHFCASWLYKDGEIVIDDTTQGPGYHPVSEPVCFQRMMTEMREGDVCEYVYLHRSFTLTYEQCKAEEAEDADFRAGRGKFADLAR